jgi:hypothetical protein
MPTDFIIRRSLLLLLVICLCANSATACDVMVRDMAFRMPRDVHRLCVMADSGDPATAEIADQLADWLDREAPDLNIEVVRVAADDPEVRWSDFGIPSAPPVLPVTVLVGTNRETGVNFVIQHWEPAPADNELAALAASPLRDQLQQELGRQLAVVIYAPCASCDDDRVSTMLSLLQREWQNVQGSELGVSVIEVDRTDPAERLLLSFTGLPPDGPDWVGVVFGRGKLMNPPLIGDEITPAALNGLLDDVLADCSCSKPLPSMGVDLPMVWAPELDDQVVALGMPVEAAEPDSITLTGLTAAPDVSHAETDVTAASAPTGGFDLYVHDTYVSIPDPAAIFKWSLGILTALVLIVGAASWCLMRRRG